MGNGECLLGEALIGLGQYEEGIAQILEGMEKMASIELHLYSTGRLSALALGQAKAGRPEEAMATLEEALALVEQTGERYWEAEIHRLRAEFQLMSGAAVKAEASLEKAIAIARRQRGKSLELRATVDLARLWVQQGKREEARQALKEIISWFREGFDEADLQEAMALISEMG